MTRTLQETAVPLATDATTHRFETAGPVGASVEIISGQVEVLAAAAPEVEVTVEAADRSDPLAVAYAAEARIDGDGDRVSVSFPHKVRRQQHQVVVRLVLPAGSDLTVRGAAVTLTTDGPLGDIAVRSASGRLSIDEARGDVTVKTAAGDVEVGEVAGAVTVQSASSRVQVGSAGGGLTVQGAAGQVGVARVRGEVRIDTAAGDIRIDALGAGRARLNAKMGNVVVGVVPGLAVKLDLHSAIGVVECDLDEGAEPDRLTAQEELRLDVHTAMGRVRVGRSELEA